MNILELIMLMIPAYIANMAPVIVRNVPWNAPVDGGVKFNNVRLFGANKTWKGLCAGICAGTVVGGCVLSIWPLGVSAWQWSVLVATGALAGDLIKSFVKRRLSIQSGKPWVPFDQIDYAVGALALGSVVFFPGWLNAGIIILISACGHIAVNHIAYALKIRGEKW